MKNWTIKLFLLLGALSLSHAVLASDTQAETGEHNEADQAASHNEADHKEEGHKEAEEEPSVKLSPQQISAAGIVSRAIQLQNVAEVIEAPGEITLNAYKTVVITPRVSAQVVERHAKLGDAVTTGQPLLTLSSVEMSGAQGNLLITEREWKRVKKLGKKVVSGQRYTEARVAHEQAKARVLAYGMTEKQITAFLSSGDASQANGAFQLLASQDGTVIHDDFIVGELIEPGKKLFIISDESMLWVEARLTPKQAALVTAGSPVNIMVDNHRFPGKVVQVHHALDEETRTLGVRIEVANPDDQLHPGVFVQARISSTSTGQALSVPVSAVLRSPDGDWVVFIEHEKNKFEPQEVEVVRTTGESIVIKGIEPGTRVVTQGAFFVQSELAKSGFEIHNH